MNLSISFCILLLFLCTISFSIPISTNSVNKRPIGKHSFIENILSAIKKPNPISTINKPNTVSGINKPNLISIINKPNTILGINKPNLIFYQ